MLMTHVIPPSPRIIVPWLCKLCHSYRQIASFDPFKVLVQLNKLEENNAMRTFIFRKDMNWLMLPIPRVGHNASVAPGVYVTFQDIIGLCCLLLGLLLSAILSFHRSRTTRQSGFRDETVEFLDRGAGWKSNAKCWIWRCLKRPKIPKGCTQNISIV